MTSSRFQYSETNVVLTISMGDLRKTSRAVGVWAIKDGRGREQGKDLDMKLTEMRYLSTLLTSQLEDIENFCSGHLGFSYPQETTGNQKPSEKYKSF